MTTIDQAVKERCGPESYRRLAALENPELQRFVARYVKLCRPEGVYVCDDSEASVEYVRQRALENGEEKKLAIAGHTVHFDGIFDQGRDKEVTKYLLPSGMNLGKGINAIGAEEGMKEMLGLMNKVMKGKEMYVLFFCLAPVDSPFSIPCVQLTDSSYVAHSEFILYRRGYEYFKPLGPTGDFFRYVHSAGELENGVSKNVACKRIYIDIANNTVFSVNTQYAGNTVGLKKLSLRLAIRKADREDWLAEHMLLMGVHGLAGRVTYFAGAFPSACGKTSTAMAPGETIVGDDIAYLRVVDDRAMAANVESGIFGIIQDVNPQADPLIWKVLSSPGEVIFSNVLVGPDGTPYWLGDGRRHPEKGINFTGPWFPGKKDAEGKPVPPAHKNARYTISLKPLDNLDPKADDPRGINLAAILYGGRDSDTWVPVERAFDWEHGVLTKGAVLESETTAATLGQEGVRVFQPMSNIDFLAIPLGRYIRNHLEFGKKLKREVVIFSVNYFLRDDDGDYLNAMEDKRVWLRWAELCVHGEAKTITTPTGRIPVYPDLKRLFQRVLDKEYSRQDYERQFTLRIPEHLAKIERMLKIYREQEDISPRLFQVFDDQKNRLLAVQSSHGDYVSPFTLAEDET